MYVTVASPTEDELYLSVKADDVSYVDRMFIYDFQPGDLTGSRDSYFKYRLLAPVAPGVTRFSWKVFFETPFDVIYDVHMYLVGGGTFETYSDDQYWYDVLTTNSIC
jgi:hypothetical protein